MTDAAVQQVEQEALVLVSQAQAIAVVDRSTFQAAGLFLRSIARYIGNVGEVFDPIVDAAHKAHKAAVEQRRKFLEPAQSAERLVKGEMSKFEQAERARVAEEQRANEAERQRLEDEARLRNAERLEAAGKPEAAERALSAPVMAPVWTPPVQPVAQVEGISFRDTWDFEIEDAALIPREYLMPDEKKIRAFVKVLKAEAKIPGIKVIQGRTSAVRA